ncbi:T6SS phospholipase effector Tle1-like catalytic domain-containing protein [Luteibacter yeojuensis]|uniref:DUF2235 domain-containing protein n=1 Tax=Luteibacter yeojuensis TaxID=345309 RepID=A0A7X5QVN2_9GAMM|nr:DUF2235 domain-containing protein [Luteibacter yeojuensis]NID16254.1 DUF2235 domain-containing protein [Luteibacter yeojuensis]
MGQLLSGGATRPATASDLDAYERMRKEQAKQRAPVLQRSNQANEYLFLALFDGTGQSAEDPKQSLTNIGHFRSQARELATNTSNRFGLGYAEGIGTQKNPITRLIDGAFPYTWDDKIEQVYWDLARKTSEWVEQDPYARIRVVGVGYSRGAVLVPGLARLIDQYGIVDPKGLTFGRDAHGNISVRSSRTLVAPGEVAQAVGLFDPVGTNLPKNYDARLPKSVLSGFSQLARDEQRELFPHQTILDPEWSEDGRFLSATLPGGHSNIGGGNRESGLESLAFNGMADYLNTLTDRFQFAPRKVPNDPAQFTIFQAGGATAAFGLRMDTDGERNLHDELANCKIVDICRDADPVDVALAARFDWQRVAPQPPRDLPHLPGAPTMAHAQAVSPPAVVPVIRLDDPSHPDHGMFLAAQSHVHALDQRFGRQPDQGSDNLSAALVVAARAGGLRQIDRVDLSPDGNTLAAVETPHGWPERRSEVSVAASMGQSMARSADEWSAAMGTFDEHRTTRYEAVREPYAVHPSAQPAQPATAHDRGTEVTRDPIGISPPMPHRHHAAPDEYDPRQLGPEKHALYNALHEHIPEASPDRLLQFTAACHAHRITAETLDTVYLDEPSMTANFRGTDWLATPAVVDLTTPPPLPEQSIQEIQQVDAHRMQIAQEIAQAIQLSQQQGLSR